MLPSVREPGIPFNPPHMICRRTRLAYTGEPDGVLDKPFWEQAEPDSDFHDIEGDALPRPLKKTEVRMLWDDDYLYIGAKLWDDEIWATVSERDGLILLDNDFEVFLSPRHTTHRYYELEMNAMNTIWDLMMEKPGRDLCHRIISWDIRGLKSAVHIEGELNNPSADNKYWSLELLIPWAPLRECTSDEVMPSHIAPDIGEVWRLNFSRVEYQVEKINNRYVKRINPYTGKTYPEYNWVWAPTGLIDIHMPEMWGYLVFGDEETQFIPPEDMRAEWELRKLFYRMRNYGASRGVYTDDINLLKRDDIFYSNPRIYITPSMFEIIADGAHGPIHIRQDGCIWKNDKDI
jgi:hypothetical protein